MPPIYLPETVSRALDLGAALVISISSGKDSQAMLMALVTCYIRYGWKGPIYALHMDLGRAEWPESIIQCQKMAACAGINLVVIRRPQGDLIQEIEERMYKLMGTEKPYWPDAGNRYCTADQKSSQSDKELRAVQPYWPDTGNRYCTAHHKTNQANKQLREFPLVISAIGIRAQESDAREKKNPLTVRDISSVKFRQDSKAKSPYLPPEQALDKWIEWRELGAKQQPLLCLDWFPIFYWNIEQVYQQCGHTIEERDARREIFKDGEDAGDYSMMALALDEWHMHPGYVYGNDRISCVFCVLGSLNDLRTGARRQPKLLKEIYIPLEDTGGKTFKNKWSLKELL